MWLHQFFCMCVRFYVVWIEAQNISHMFTISSDYFLQIVLFCFFSLCQVQMLYICLFCQSFNHEGGTVHEEWLLVLLQRSPNPTRKQRSRTCGSLLPSCHCSQSSNYRGKDQMAAKGCIRACTMHQPRTMCPEIKVEEGNLCGQCPEQCRISSGKVAEKIAADKSWKVKVWI